MLCQSCGKWTPDDFTFCNQCGSRMSPPMPPAPQAWSPTPTPQQQAWSPTLTTPQQAWSPIPTPPQQPIGPPWGRGIQQTAGNPPIAPGSYATNSYTAPSHNPDPAWQDYQVGQSAFPEYLSQQAFAPPPPQEEAPWSQTFPQGQLHRQGGSSSSPPEPNRVQHLLIQLFQPSLAANPWLGIIIGGVSPALLGALFFIIILSVLHVPQSSASGLNSLNTLASSPINVIPMGNSVRDGLQALLVALGVSRHITGSYAATAGSLTLNVDLSSPLQITLLIPALLLVAGGYLAACTDMSNRVVASLWRGAAISLPYMLLLLLFSTQANGDVPLPQLPQTASSSILSLLQGQVSITLAMNVASLILLSLFWGTLCGLLGASFKLARGHWRGWLHRFLRSNTHYRLTGILAGGLVAILLGFLLALLLSYVAMVSNVQFAQGSTCRAAGASSSLTTSAVTAGPLIAVQLFDFSFGTPISLNFHASGMSAITNLLAASGCMGQTSFSLFGGIAHSSPWIYLLLFLPIISLFAGGRVSAYLGRPASLGIAGIQGALVAIPFTIVMMILTALSMISLSIDISGSVVILGNIPDTNVALSLGASVIDVMVWSLLSGVFLGALGGVYQASAVSRNIDAVLAHLGRALLVFSGPACMLIDRLGARRPGMLARGRTLNILGSALMIAIILTVMSIAVGILLIAFSSTVTYDLNHKLHSIMSALLIALPGLLLLCTLFSALFEEPPGAAQSQGTDKMNLRQTSGGIV